MRIGFVSSFPPIECGIATYTSYLNQALRKIGNETFVVAPVGAQGEDVFPVYRPDSLSMASQIYNISAQITPDVIHVQHEFGLYGTQKGVQIIEVIVRYKLAGVPVITTLHTVYEKINHEEETILHLILSESSAVIVHEKYQKDTLCRYFGKGYGSKIYVIPHGVRDVSPVKDAKQKLQLEGKKVVLLCGYFRPTKGFRKMVELMPKLCAQAGAAARDIIFLIAGKAQRIEFQGYQKDFFERINNSPVNDKIVVLRGQFPQYTFDTIVSASDVVVLPYDLGGQSGIMAQCYAFNKPVVTSNLLAFRKIIERSRGGLICESEDDYIRNIIKIVSEDNLVRELQSNIKKYVQNEVQWSKVAKQHIDVYHTVVKVPYGRAKYVYWEEGS